MTIREARRAIRNSASAKAVLCLFFAALLMAVSGCSSTKYHDDYRPDTDFSHFKTYQWRNVSSEIDGISAQRLQQLADDQLAAQGFSRTEGTPDMLLDLTLVTRTSTGSSKGIGLSIGLPIGRHGSIGVGGGKSIADDKREGVLILDASDSMNNRAVWRGSAEGIPMSNFSLKSEQKLAAVVTKLIQQFPAK